MSELDTIDRRILELLQQPFVALLIPTLCSQGFKQLIKLFVSFYVSQNCFYFTLKLPA